jgi:hypothetical protein
LKIILPSLLLILALTSSCTFTNRSVENGYYMENFDNLRMWNNNAVVDQDYAHSGKFSAYVDTAHPFSETFQMHMDIAQQLGYKSADISAWVMKFKEDTQAGLVAEITDHSGPEVKTISYQSFDIGKNFPHVNSWGEIKLHIDFPKEYGPSRVLKIYLVSGRGDKTNMDDFCIHFHKSLL